MNRSRLFRLVLLGSCALLLIGSVFALAAPSFGADTIPALNAARVRWAARPFARYQMRVQDICDLDVTVDGAQVVAGPHTLCASPRRTIDDLFALIARDQTVTYSCVARGCACDDVMSVRAAYDPHLGYPTAIEVRVSARPNPANLDFWRQMWATWSIPRCAMMMDGSKTIRVMTLRPL